MLVLGRTPDNPDRNQIMLETSDGLVTVTVIPHTFHAVRVGIDAPPSVRIHRGENWEPHRRQDRA